MTFPFLGAFGPAAMLGGVSDPGTFQWLNVVEADDSGQNQSFANVGFGAAQSTRLIILNVHWIFGSINRTLISATIGGVSATIHEQDSHSGGSTGLGCAIISALVPTGTSGTVELNFSSGFVSRGTISVIRATNLVSNTPFDTLEVRGSNDTHINGTIDIPSNGALLIAGTGSTNTSGDDVVITGATEIYDGNFSSGAGTRGAALITGLSAETARTCRYNMGSIPDSGTEMIACSWQLRR